MTVRAWVMLLLIVFLVIPGWIVGKSYTVLNAAAINPAVVFPEEVIPERYEPLSAIQGDRGRLYEFYDSETRTKFSLIVSLVSVIAAGQESAVFPATGEELVKVLVRRQNSRFTDQPELAHFTQSFLGSAFDPQRAYEFRSEPALASLGASHFITHRDANYLLSAWRLADKEVALLAMVKGHPVDADSYRRFFDSLAVNVRK